ncbi:hypothetical protein GCM10010911_45510 [Paenibacillus nasutitermitis]|uniref:Carbohydrate-binding domain-containing protein n=2 Tax=Paenibacillus nasutitermitis TaxID=1652958 RepID=A0A917DZ46_9BACL|nr:hypothetical protein GCM10010911_45510 [Paenibacillus nasutitermitis]
MSKRILQAALSLILICYALAAPLGVAAADGAAVVTANPPAGVIAKGAKVNLSAGASAIRYTTDGSDPRSSATAIEYAGPITVDNALTLRAASEVSTGVYGDVEAFHYELLSVPGWSYEVKSQADATIALDSGVSHSGGVSLKLTSATPPAANVYARVWQNVTVKPNTTYQFNAWVKGNNVNADISVNSAWSPRYSIPSGDWQQLGFTYTTGANETLLSYRIVVPNVTDALWIDDITFTESGSSVNLLVNPGFEVQLEPVRASVAAGAVPAGTEVVLTAAPAAQIFYTADGSDPRSSATVITYTGPLSIDGDVTLRAFAVDGWLTSAVSDFAYTVLPVAVEPTVLGGIFIDEPPAFAVRTAGDRLTWSVNNPEGELVLQGEAALTSPIYSLQPTLADKGYFTLQVSAWQGTVLLGKASTPFTVLEEADVAVKQDSRFAMGTHFAKFWNDDLVPLLDATGISAIRDEHEWKNLEKQKGVFSFPARNDAYMARLEQEGVQPLIVLDYTNSFYDNGYTPYTSEGYNGFANYADQVLQHYDGEIPWVEVYNEYNNSNFGDMGAGPADCKPEYYFELLKATYQKIKQNHPAVTVAGPVTVGLPWEWLETFFQLGGLDYLDVVSVHPYNFPNAPEILAERIDQLDSLIREYNNGQPKPIWISEIGWPSYSGSEGVDERTQAQYIVRSHVTALASGVDKIFWYNMMNDGINKEDRESNFGLIRNLNDPQGAYAPKPAYAAYGVMLRQLGGMAYVSQDVAPASVYSYKFQAGQQTAHVLWSLEPVNVALQASGDLTIVDAMGNEEVYTPHDGKIYLTLDETPLYVKGEVLGIAADGTFTLQAENALVGEVIDAVVIWNNEASTTSASAALEAEGVTVPLAVAAGAVVTEAVVLPAKSSAGVKTLTAAIKFGGVSAGRIAASVSILGSAVTASEIKHGLDANGGHVLRLTLANELAVANELTEIQWSFGSQSGATTFQTTIPASGQTVVSLPVPSLTEGQTYPFQLQLQLEEGNPVAASGSLNLVPASAMTALAKKTVDVEGTNDDWSGVNAIDLATETTAVPVTGHSFGGATDLGGDLRLTWDDDYLYVSASVNDDTFAQSYSGSDIWKGDSLQFALTAGFPGETVNRFEYGAALTSSAAELYRFSAPSGMATGSVANARVNVARDGTNAVTTYKIAVPWSELGSLSPTDRALSFSLLVNDDDGAGRKGWREWGSGIGSGKNPALFKAVWLQEQP